MIDLQTRISTPNKTKILVVDDEKDVEFLMKQRFSKQIKNNELEFVFASNGAEALQTIESDKEINVILTDINMPEMDGLMLLTHLAELKRIFRTVIISAYGDMSNIRKAMNRGACDFITKPIDFKDLEITIFNAIEQSLTLKRAVEAEKILSDLEKELAIAQSIQEAILPHYFKPLPDNNDFEIYGTMIPAKQVGGDFFDFFPLGDKCLGFVIADVSGKGIPAALFMSMSRAIIRTIAQNLLSPKACLEEANRILNVDNDTCMFVTTFYGIYHTDTGIIECANAGHNPPFILKTDGSLECITKNEGIPLGIVPDVPYTSHTIQLNKGDTLILYTDGVTEAMNTRREFYTVNRFMDVLKKWHPGSDLSTLANYILDDLSQFAEGAPNADDITLLCMRQLT